ncbi:uncharacterized protein LOC106642017 [Copidosoma floridanum]|uniref:uncharacterized protein LOC106642017 n=1 Tax=Copidosoma floridanum TaxID=29053 RepID=UPI0006C9C276|nr:uncharacterized protein LOC106642017 [Copidosoma floridanum]
MNFQSVRTGRKRHAGWDGYDDIRNDKGVITHAKCKKCKKELVRRDEATLKKHAKLCKGLQNENNANASNSSQASYSSSDEKSNCDDFSMDVDKSSENTRTTCGDINEKSLVSQQPVEITNDMKNICVLKFFLSCNIDLDNITHRTTVDLFKAFNHEVPTVAEFKSNTLQQAMDNTCKKNKLKKHSKILSLKICQSDTQVSCLVFLFNDVVHEEPTFIDLKIIEKDHDPNLTTAIDSFCKSCIKKAFNLYNTSIKFIIHDGEFELQSEGTISFMAKSKDIRLNYTCLVGVDTVITRLKNCPLRIPIKDFPLLTGFYDALNNLEKSIISKNLNLSEATQRLFLLMDNQPIIHSLTHDAMIGSELHKQIQEIHLASNYFHPLYRGTLFTNYISLCDKVNEFVQKTAPTDIFDALGYYRDKDGCFNKLYSICDATNHVLFWNLAKVENASISDYALDLLKIPGTSQRINTKTFFDRVAKYDSHSFELNSLIFSVIYESKK